MSNKNWSSQQQAIFDFFTTGKGNLVVRARAGTGKTTTIIEALNHARHEAKILLAAFNKRIAVELTSRVTAPNAAVLRNGDGELIGLGDANGPWAVSL